VQWSAQGYTYPRFRESESSTTQAGQPVRGENANAAEKEAAGEGNLSGRLPRSSMHLRTPNFFHCIASVCGMAVTGAPVHS
jgi:hypothetical protein